MSPWQRPGRFSQQGALRASGLSLPPSHPPTPPAHPAGLLVFCPAWPTFPSSPWEKASRTASRAIQRPRLGRRGPTPACSCHWSQGGGWVWDGGAVEDPEHWPTEPGVNTDKSLELPSLPLSLSPYFTGKDPECCPGPISLGLGFSPAACPPFSWPPPVSIFLEHLLCPLSHFLLSPSHTSLPLPLLPSFSSSTL